MDHAAVQQSWDAQQEAYVPDREVRLNLMVRLVEQAAGPQPRVLDLAGGTGSITRRVLDRLPGARSVVVDTDPVLLAIAAATFADDDRVEIVDVDLRDPTWTGRLPDPTTRFDGVLTATALHWLEPDRVAGVYREAATLLCPGGVLANSDHLPDAGLTALGDDLAALEREREAAARSATGAPDWSGWWEALRAQPDLATAFAARDARREHDPTGGHTRSLDTAGWHLDALTAAGCTAAGVVWRYLGDAVVVGVMPR